MFAYPNWAVRTSQTRQRDLILTPLLSSFYHTNIKYSLSCRHDQMSHVFFLVRFPYTSFDRCAIMSTRPNESCIFSRPFPMYLFRSLCFSTDFTLFSFRGTPGITFRVAAICELFFCKFGNERDTSEKTNESWQVVLHTPNECFVLDSSFHLWWILSTMVWGHHLHSGPENHDEGLDRNGCIAIASLSSDISVYLNE